MDWKKWLEEHAFFVVVGACVATGGVVAGVMQYFSTQTLDLANKQHAAEIADLNSRLSSIARSVGHEDYLDVHKIVVTRSHIQAPTLDRYFADADFYASDQPKWVYEKTTEAALIRRLTGVDLSTGPLQAIATHPVHVWRSKDMSAVQGNEVFKNVFPFIEVGRMTLSDFKRAVGQLASALDDHSTETTAEKSRNDASLSGNRDTILESLFRGDLAGTMMTLSLWQLTTSSIASDMVLELLNVQKVDNVVYFAVRRTMRNVSVRGEKVSRYYVTDEYMIISDGPEIVLIHTMAPSSDPSRNREAFRTITAWFENLRVVVG